MKVQTIFERTEIKYIITLKQREALLKLISSYIKPDEYGESTVCSLYFDTDVQGEAQTPQLFHTKARQQRVP